ncbi:fumarate reductase/succinate dehydrogenase flavoprotein subunit [Protofrankia symbiont of Coriaria ruscifolia]|uniref:fumarate reductase/succinate dehydrogenase flavoprotein subunit n=1 Tax=Protofrankia symbiont of Coriaria ruscifolia TaxID=1306542 RepID=UPI001041455C|nr:fumarate reductase/succinate dehydrogenase flavoprotein subunit [Protofrankia symbiont of Coriaria ruscifolia]
MTTLERHAYDVIVIGAGGAGLRAALEAHEQGARVAVVCKSLLGKAHTVMAEGGIAAAMGNVWPEDNWQTHFRDTMRGGKMLNQWQMAQIHAQEAPARVWELEEWGAVFDRTPDGRILQRDFGGHRFARLAHVGDRTGLELIRTLQNRLISKRIDVFMECTVLRLLTAPDPAPARPAAPVQVTEPARTGKPGVPSAPGETGEPSTPAHEGRRIAGAFAYWRESGTFVRFDAPAVVLATGGIGKSYQVTSNSWEYTGDGHALALWAGAALMDMEFVQFHPTGMVWPPSVKGILVTEGVRGDGGVLLNSAGRRFMFDYIPPIFAAETAGSEEEADRWYTDKKTARRPPELLPRDEVARAINTEIKAGRGSPHGGVYLDIASRRDPEYIRRRLPSMYHQFTELADVDITREAMEVGPTCHYVMGGIKVDPPTAAATVPGLFAAGECAAGMHGSNRLGGNSLSDLLVFGRRAGMYAARYAQSVPPHKRAMADDAQINAVAAQALAPFDTTFAQDTTKVGASHTHPPENPYQLQNDLQEVMQRLVGIIRTEPELARALKEIETLRSRARHVAVVGHRQYNPGWHLALDLGSLLTVAECIATAALARRESRGGHTRDDYPSADPAFATLNHVLRLRDERLVLTAEPLPAMPPEFAALFEQAGAGISAGTASTGEKGS